MFNLDLSIDNNNDSTEVEIPKSYFSVDSVKKSKKCDVSYWFI